MPSRAFMQWTSKSSKQLDEMVGAHAAVGGSQTGRRRATQQINHAYLVLVAAMFQRFCRDLHTESVNAVLGPLRPRPEVETVLLAIAAHGRQLDSRNATGATIAADFNPLGLRILDDLKKRRAGNAKRLQALDRLNVWRNAIAHQDFGRPLEPARIQLKAVSVWRRQCAILARDLDRVMCAHLTKLVGAPPW